MSERSSIVINFKKVEHQVPSGFTAEEFVEALAASDPSATNAQLIKDGEKDGQTLYTLKVMRGEHG